MSLAQMQMARDSKFFSTLFKSILFTLFILLFRLHLYLNISQTTSNCLQKDQSKNK